MQKDREHEITGEVKKKVKKSTTIKREREREKYCVLEKAEKMKA